MERCFWDLQVDTASGLLTLVCDFREGRFTTSRKMQILYTAAAELADSFQLTNLQCLIGLGPLYNNFQEDRWQLVLIPDEKGAQTPQKREELTKSLYEFSKHLNEMPIHHLRDLNPKAPKTDPHSLN